MMSTYKRNRAFTSAGRIMTLLAAVTISAGALTGCSSSTDGSPTAATSSDDLAAAQAAAVSRASAAVPMPSYDLTNPDTLFLMDMSSQNISFGSQDKMVATGHAVCDDLRAGRNRDEVNQNIAAASGLQDPKQIRVVAIAAMVTWCENLQLHYLGFN